MASFFGLTFIFILQCLELSHSFTFTSTVSKDGTGDFDRVSDAIAAAPRLSSIRIYIHVKPGLYVEHVEIPSEKTFISLMGDDDASKTIILDGRNNQHNSSTTSSATFTVKGNHFMAQFITFENSAGPGNGQAVAFLDEANYTSYYKCVFKGYQDTLFVRGSFQFYKECNIYGSIDFIFGEGLVLFQDCNIYARLSGVMTAQSKTKVTDRSGFTFQSCNISTSPEMKKGTVNVYLGRPWRNYSTVIIMQSFLDTVIDPEGWQAWGSTPLNQLFYAEYKNSGPRADTSERVKWPGFHVLHTEEEASKFTVEKFINGNEWLPETGIPFRAGLHP